MKNALFKLGKAISGNVWFLHSCNQLVFIFQPPLKMGKKRLLLQKNELR